MAKYDHITADFVRSILEYDPETGIFRWKHRSDVVVNVDAKLSGKIAGSKCSNGYLEIGICSHKIKAHRVAWIYVSGEWPKHEIDHINGERSDNRIANLRSVTTAQNARNTGPRKTNKSGFKGVHWHSQRKRWTAQIRIDGGTRHVGLFDTAEEANEAYQKLAIVNFGEYEK